MQRLPTGALAVVVVALTGCRSADHVALPVAFAREIGVWEGVRRDVASMSQAPMTLRVEELLGGSGVLRALEVQGDEGTYRGTAVLRYDRSRADWVWQYTSSAARPFARYRAVAYEPDRSEWRSITPNRARESRLVSEHRMDGSWRRTMAVSEDGGTTWRELWVDELRRR